MKITYLVLGPFMTNTYIIYDENTMDAVIIDPYYSCSSSAKSEC